MSEEIRDSSRNSKLVVACCVCNSINLGNGSNPNWKPVDNRDYANVMDDYGYIVSHGYCPPCAEKAFKELRETR